MTAVMNFYDEPHWFHPVSPISGSDLCTPGRSCCYVALLALSAVRQVRIHSFFPPLQSAFVSPLTVDIVGREVTVAARSIAVMWTTMEEVPSQGDMRINHVVAL